VILAEEYSMEGLSAYLWSAGVSPAFAAGTAALHKSTFKETPNATIHLERND